MSDIPKMMHKPREFEVAHEAVGGGVNEVPSFESANVPLDLHYPTTGVDHPAKGTGHRSPWTAEHFWTVAPLTASIMGGGGPEGARRAGTAMWKFFQWLKGGKAPPSPPAISNAPRVTGSANSGQAAELSELGALDEGLTSTLAKLAGDRYRVVATYERNLLERMGSGEGFPKHAKTLMPFGNFSSVIVNPITHEADKISISTTYAVDKIYMIVKGNKGVSIHEFELSYLGRPLEREIEALKSYFRNEFKVPPVRAQRPLAQPPIRFAHEPSPTSTATPPLASHGLQHGESTINLFNRVTNKSEAITCSWEVEADRIVGRAVGPEGKAIHEILSLDDLDNIENILMHSYAMRYFASP